MTTPDTPPPAPYRAPDLAAECASLRAECERLRAIIDGRTTPPTDAEIDAHAAAGPSDLGGQWRVTDRDGAFDWIDAEELRRFLARGTFIAPVRYWPIDRDGRPCPWPVVPAEGARP